MYIDVFLLFVRGKGTHVNQAPQTVRGKGTHGN